MARKETNIFGTSFLDLLSGALGAVLILFIIIPKMTRDDRNALEQLEELQSQVSQLEELMEQNRNSISRELFEQIQAQHEAMQNTINQLTEQVRNMQEHTRNLENENTQLRGQLEQIQQQLSEAQQRLREQQAQNTEGPGGKIFGMNAELGVVCQWPENVDVDLFVKNLMTNEICYYGRKQTPFGNLQEDITSRPVENDDRYELFYQTKIIPGKYQIYVNIYRGQNPATVDGYVVMFPGSAHEQKIPYRQIYLPSEGQNVIIGTLEVTQNNINLFQ
jgi:hypothetical protein